MSDPCSGLKIDDVIKPISRRIKLISRFSTGQDNTLFGPPFRAFFGPLFGLLFGLFEFLLSFGGHIGLGHYTAMEEHADDTGLLFFQSWKVATRVAVYIHHITGHDIPPKFRNVSNVRILYPKVVPVVHAVRARGDRLP